LVSFATFANKTNSINILDFHLIFDKHIRESVIVTFDPIGELLNFDNEALLTQLASLSKSRNSN